MDIFTVLETVDVDVKATGNHTFDLDEISALMDLNGLRALKLAQSVVGYKASGSLEECTVQIKKQELNYYRVLDYCAIRNRALRKQIRIVFPEWEL